MVYECPRHCHVNDKGGRCPRCDQWMKSHGSKTQEEVLEMVKVRQQAERKNVGNSKRMDSAKIRRFQENMKQEEIKYFRNLNANK